MMLHHRHPSGIRTPRHLNYTTVPKHPRRRRRMSYEGTPYRDEDEDDDDDDDGPRCRPLKVLRNEAGADDDDDDDDDDDEMMLTQGHPSRIRTF